MASQAGFEPATYGLEVRCSIQLSYWEIIKDKNGAGDGNRTHATGLEGQGSTIELHPPELFFDFLFYDNNLIIHKNQALVKGFYYSYFTHR